MRRLQTLPQSINEMDVLSCAQRINVVLRDPRINLRESSTVHSSSSSDDQRCLPCMVCNAVISQPVSRTITAFHWALCAHPRCYYAAVVHRLFSLGTAVYRISTTE